MIYQRQAATARGNWKHNSGDVGIAPFQIQQHYKDKMSRTRLRKIRLSFIKLTLYQLRFLWITQLTSS